MSYSNEDTFKAKDKLVQDCLDQVKRGITRCDYVHKQDARGANGRSVIQQNEMESNNMGSGTYPTDTKLAQINQVAANEPTELQGFGDGDSNDNGISTSQASTKKEEMAEKKPDVGSEKE